MPCPKKQVKMTSKERWYKKQQVGDVQNVELYQFSEVGMHLQFFLMDMNGKKMKIIEGDQCNLQEQTQEKKTFRQQNFNINYVNTSKIFYQENSHSIDVKVNNYLCQQNGNELVKVTEILYEDKLIRIEDRFDVQYVAAKMEQSQENSEKKKSVPKNTRNENREKVRLFGSQNCKNGVPEKKDKKNIVKNMVKMFHSWMERMEIEKKDKKYSESFLELNKLISQEKFNNRLIRNIVNNKIVSKLFHAFLTECAQDEVKYSRIQDKQSHYEAINLYNRLIEQNSNLRQNLESSNQVYQEENMSEKDRDESYENNDSIKNRSSVNGGSTIPEYKKVSTSFVVFSKNDGEPNVLMNKVNV